MALYPCRRWLAWQDATAPGLEAEQSSGAFSYALGWKQFPAEHFYFSLDFGLLLSFEDIGAQTWRLGMGLGTEI